MVSTQIRVLVDFLFSSTYVLTALDEEINIYKIRIYPV